MKQSRYWPYAPLAFVALAMLAGGCGHRSSGANEASDQSGPLAAFRAKFPGTAALVTAVSGLRQILKSGQDPMTPRQAGLLLAYLVPLGSRASLPQDDARTLSKNIIALLSPQQQMDIGSMREERRGSRRGGGTRAGGAADANAGGASATGPSAGGRQHGGDSGGAGGAGAGRGGFTFDQNMAPDTNVFASGRLHESLQETITMIQAYEGS